MQRICTIILSIFLFTLCAACGQENQNPSENAMNDEASVAVRESAVDSSENVPIPEHFVLIEGGTFQMGSPEDEPWRSEDEIQHSVTVSDFYMSAYEVTQQEYQDVMGDNPIQYGKLHQRGGI